MTTTATTSTWTIDPTHAEIGFAVRHLMISTVRGRFAGVTGTATIDEANPANSTIDVTIDAASIDTRQEMRDNHLRSPDFFDVATYPTLRFVSKRVDGDVGGTFTVVGDLTIRGVTREVVLEVESEGSARDPWGNERRGYAAKGKIDRREFGLVWNQALETGGVMVSDDVKLSFDIELVRQKAEASVAA